MQSRFSRLDHIGLAALACYGLGVLPFVPRMISNVAGSFLCFVFVGLAWASALMPRHASAVARLVAVVACSLAVGVVGGLILHFLPAGLVRFNWLTYAVLATGIGYGLARVRNAEAVFGWNREKLSTPSWSGWLKAAGSLLVLIVAVAVSVNSTNANEKEFTELWLVPDSPRNSPVRAVHATLGVKSHESSTQQFTIVMNTGKKLWTSEVTLAPQQVWSRPVIVEGVEATASLYRGDVLGQPYRRVWLARQ